tara:strand:- start:332 stop:541 length:210 start_codon:yes stop_codon:yes gene_type:complete
LVVAQVVAAHTLMVTPKVVVAVDQAAVLGGIGRLWFQTLWQIHKHMQLDRQTLDFQDLIPRRNLSTLRE